MTVRRESTIRAEFPGSIRYRDLAVRMVTSAVRFVTTSGSFRDQVISAFGEAFNNVALHGYRGRPPGDIRLEIDVAANVITIRLMDYGHSFDPAGMRAPDLDTLPESGMGIYIMRSFMDDVSYTAGNPNVLTMTKRHRVEEGTPETP
jgi:serine/threonine-protein kinase RsbW